MYFKKWKEFVVINEDVNTNPNSQQGTNAPTPQTTNSTPSNNQQGTNSAQPDISKLSGEKLQEILDKWNNAYSQDFKFLNNMPKQVKNENTIDELLVNIPEEYKIKVREGITKLVEFFKNKNIADSFNGKELLIIGYTSTTASESYNQALSLRRAKIVANAIRNLLKQLNLNIKFKEEGMGENPDGLIVVNDQDLEPIQLGKNAPQLSDDILNILKNNKEERQKINRRVKITLPEFKFKEPIVKPEDIKPSEETKEVVVEKPELPEPENIKFNLNSFILTKESQSLLTTFCNELKSWNTSTKEEDAKIKTVYISAHTKLGKGDNKKEKEDSERQKHMLAILASNRGQYVKDFIKSKLGEENVKNLNFYVYPVAYTMGEEKKVVINFEKGEHMKKAEELFTELANTYKLPIKNNSLENLATYMENEPLLEILDKNIKASIKDGDNDKYVPLELWYDELSGYQGFKKYANYRKSFKDRFDKMIVKENKRYGRDYTLESFVYSPQ